MTTALCNYVTYQHGRGCTWHVPATMTHEDRAVLDYAMTTFGYLLNRPECLHREVSLSEFAELIRTNFDSDRADICADVLKSVGQC
jgi:hypothetical protein